MKNKFNKAFWANKYANNLTGWDIGSVSTPLKEYFDQLDNKEIKILIPGAGNSYEAEYLFNKDFQNVSIVDIAHQPLNNIKKRIPNFSSDKLIQVDFFEHDSKYELIIEQTFFCALPPDLRTEYVKKMHDLLEEKGKIIGLLFDEELNTDEPPFGGSKNEYLELFSKYFHIKTLDKCYNSIKPRFGTELFFIFEKK